MNRNMGTADRIVRAILGVGAIAWAGSMGWSSTAAIVVLVVAGLLVVTAALGFCPLYRLLGLSTYRPEHAATIASEDAHDAARH